jgi:hypothetical protein
LFGIERAFPAAGSGEMLHSHSLIWRSFRTLVKRSASVHLITPGCARGEGQGEQTPVDHISRSPARVKKLIPLSSHFHSFLPSSIASAAAGASKKCVPYDARPGGVRRAAASGARMPASPCAHIVQAPCVSQRASLGLLSTSEHSIPGVGFQLQKHTRLQRTRVGASNDDSRRTAAGRLNRTGRTEAIGHR